MDSLGSIPDNFGLGDVWSVALGTTLPQSVIGRRAEYDELIWDADGGFAGNWVGRSSLGGDGTVGYTMLLARRAYSAAGFALFSLVASGGGGGGTLAGDVTGPAGTNTVVKIQGKAVAAPVTTGHIPHYDGTGIVWGAPAAGSGDVVGPASAVDSRIAAFDTTTGKLLKDGGYTIAGVIAAAAPVPALYNGHSTGASITFPGTSFAAVTTLLSGGSYVDQLATGIARSGSAFTVSVAGYYRISFHLNTYSSAVTVMLRVQKNGTTVLLSAGYSGGLDAITNQLDGIVQCSASDVLTFEAAASGSGSTFGSVTVDGEVNRNLLISINKL